MLILVIKALVREIFLGVTKGEINHLSFERAFLQVVEEVEVLLRVRVEEIDEYEIVVDEAAGDEGIGEVRYSHGPVIDTQEVI